ncbi:hypothetical protein [Halegenticoccus soli]|uniref:hypothetical protein n=1 Tax=Halegenticoccus soli TaxID=1985678 RepID=UPI000C6DF397|nr:hypothetical protein [Halegenticoccus soli]
MGCLARLSNADTLPAGSVEITNRDSKAHAVTITVEPLNASGSDSAKSIHTLTVGPGETATKQLITEPGEYNVTAQTKDGTSDSVDVSLTTYGDGLAGDEIAISIESGGGLRITTATGT